MPLMNERSSTIRLCCFSLFHFLKVDGNIHQHLNGSSAHPLAAATGWFTDLRV